jgi:ribosome-associated translation inhibitor RaiA
MFARMADVSAKKKQPTVHAVPRSSNIDLATMMMEKSINKVKKKRKHIMFQSSFPLP